MRVRMRPHKAFKVLSSTLRAGSSHDTVGIIALAAVAFAAVTGWRFADPNPGSGVFFLLTVPISLLAFRFGVRGGLAGASIGIGLTVVWAQSQGAAIGESGYPVRAAVFVIVGVVVGWQSQRRHRVEREADRWFSMTGELACVASFQGYFTRVNPPGRSCLDMTNRNFLADHSCTSYTPTTSPQQTLRPRRWRAGHMQPSISRIATSPRMAAGIGWNGAPDPTRAPSTPQPAT